MRVYYCCFPLQARDEYTIRVTRAILDITDRSSPHFLKVFYVAPDDEAGEKCALVRPTFRFSTFGYGLFS